jgi:hypothetical protein
MLPLYGLRNTHYTQKYLHIFPVMYTVFLAAFLVTLLTFFGGAAVAYLFGDNQSQD